MRRPTNDISANSPGERSVEAAPDFDDGDEDTRARRKRWGSHIGGGGASGPVRLLQMSIWVRVSARRMSILVPDSEVHTLC